MFWRSPNIRRAGASLIVLANVACYAYVPMAAGAHPRVDERVRVTLTPQGTMDLAQFLGPRVHIAEGTLARVADDGALVVGVDFVRLLDGVRQPWTGEGVVSFAPAHIDVLSERVFQRRRTVVASTLLAVALVASAVIALRTGGAEGGPGGGGGPPPP